MLVWIITDIVRFLGLLVVSTLKAEDPGFDSRLRRGDYSGSSHTCDLKIDTPVATLPGAWPWDLLARCQYTVTG